MSNYYNLDGIKTELNKRLINKRQMQIIVSAFCNGRIWTKMIILQRESRYEVVDPDCVFKVNVYLRNDGEHYVTSANHGMELCSG